MAINLSSYPAIGNALIVKIVIDQYSQSQNVAYTSQTLRFSDWNSDITVDDELYQGLGRLVSISDTVSELKSSTGSLTLTISGIPNTSIAEIVHSRIKGSKISVKRVIFDPVTNLPLEISGNPAGRFFGIINNYTLDEEYEVETRTSTNTIGLICSSTAEVLGNKLAGRKTNADSYRAFNQDPSMDRVTSLVGANFDFGVPK